MDDAEIIILSEDEEHDRSCREPSVLLVENEKEHSKDEVGPPCVVDEDLVVTFSRHADVLPHARYDCPIHPFTATDCEVGAAVAGNQHVCDQCFCYICDKLASLCPVWCHPGVCHCNSHKKSDYWCRLRNTTALGMLSAFNLTSSEMDDQLRQAESMLRIFKAELSAAFASFVTGKPAQGIVDMLPAQNGLVHDYTPVFQLASTFLSKADERGGRAAAVMRLGAAECFMQHFNVMGNLGSDSPSADVTKAKTTLLHRVLTSVQRQMVLCEFADNFSLKLQNFYEKLYLPPELRRMRNSLCVRPWSDVLLASVLKGQNVSGFRRDKGRKDLLMEQMSVVLLRAELLQQQNRYRELSRYIRVVQADDPKPLQQIQDLLPFFLCKSGNLPDALRALTDLPSSPAARLSPGLFLVYLRIFSTAATPELTVTQPEQLCSPHAAWQPVKGAVPLRRTSLVKFVLRVQRCCPAVYADSQCWVQLLTIFNTPAQAKPTPTVIKAAADAVWSVLLDPQDSNIQIPGFFHEMFSQQALLLLVTGALAMRVLDGALTPVLPVLNTYKDNVWAFTWLCEILASNVERLATFYQEIMQEIQSSKDVDSSPPFLLSIAPSSGDQESTS